MNLHELLQSQGLIILNGAMGTELDKMGNYTRCENNITNPENVMQVHKNYISAGSMAIITNTCTMNRIFIETHNIEGLINKIVCERHTVIFGFEHPNHWSPKTIGKILENSGYEVQKVFHSSLDFTINDILRYYCTPTFTTIMPMTLSKRQYFFKLLRAPFLFSPIRLLDRTITSWIPNYLKKGSVIKVIAEKRKELSS